MIFLENTLIESIKKDSLTLQGIVVDSMASGTLAAFLTIPEHPDRFMEVFGVAYVINALVAPTLMYGGKKVYDALRAYATKE